MLQGFDGGKGDVRCGGCVGFVVLEVGNTQLVCKVGLVLQSRKAVVEEGALGKEGAKEHLTRKERPGWVPDHEVIRKNSHRNHNTHP